MITHHCLTWLEGLIHEENVLVLIYGNSNLFFCLKKKRYCCIIDGSGYCVKMSPCSTPDHEVPTLSSFAVFSRTGLKTADGNRTCEQQAAAPPRSLPGVCPIELSVVWCVHNTQNLITK